MYQEYFRNVVCLCSVIMEKVLVHTSDVSHVKPLSKHCMVQVSLVRSVPTTLTLSLEQAYSTLCGVRANSEKFGLNAGNMKFNTQ
jgi:hypothetical protein